MGDKRAGVAELMWGDAAALKFLAGPSGFDTVIASDCVYLLDTLDDLLDTLAGAGPHHEVLLSYEDRSSGVEKEFFQRATDRGWTWEEVSVEGNDYYAPEIHILRMKLRPSQPTAE